MPSNEVKLLRYRSQSDLQTLENLRRSTGEGGLSEINPYSNPGLSMLSLSKTRVSVGDNVTIYWDIRENILCGANDWIGLFELDGPMALSNYLDYKQRGVTIAKRGAIKWSIKRDVTLGEVEKKCIFKYIHAPTGCVRAVSPTLYVYNPYAELTAPYSSHRPSLSIPAETLLEFSIAGLQANGLKKNIFGKPSPYVKLSIMPSRRHRRSWKQHHGQIAKTSSQPNTINPKWTSEEFVFLGGPEDLLEVEVRNKFSGARPALSRFLGRLSIPLMDIFECQGSRPEEFTKPLGKRTPADRVQGTITVTITVIVPCAGGPTSTQQENVPPSASANGASGISSPRNSSQGCVLSNPSLMSSAPNILRPLTLNSSNGVLETVFPVEDHTPSPVSPYAFADQENMSSNTPDSISRRQLYIRPFSEIYSGEFLPLDIDIQSQGSPQNSERSQVVNGESEINEDEAINEESVELDSADEFAAPTVESTGVDTVDIAGNDSGMPLESSHEELENQPMEIPEESSDINDPGIAMVTQASVNEEEIVPCNRAERNSVASIELTADSPLRILEESERVRAEEIALSHENLLQENALESDDEIEEMDTSEAGTVDETDGAQLPSTLTLDSVMEEPTQSRQEGDATTLPSLVNDSLANQDMSDAENHLAASENSSNTSAEHDGLLEVTLTSLSEAEEPVQDQPFLEFQPAPSVAEIPAHLGTEERANSGSTERAQLLEQSVSNPVSQPPESVRNCLGGVTGSSLLEYVERNVGNDSVEGSRTEELSGEDGGTMPDNSGTESGQSDPNFGAFSVTLPMETLEPICLDATSVQTASSTEVLVDTPAAMEVTSSVAYSYSTSSGVRDGGDGIPPSRPPRVKRIARSSSDPRSVQAKICGDRLRNTPGEAAGSTYSPRLTRPELRRRSSEPQQNSVLVSVSGAAAEDVAPTASCGADQNDLTSSDVPAAVADSEPSAVESIVMAVPLLSPPQQTSSSSATAPVVVANVVPESVAMVTPILSPDLESDRRTASTNSQSTVVAVPLNPRDIARVASGPTRSQDRYPSDSRGDYVVIVPAQSSQISSAPSTLQRSDIAPLVRRASDQRRNMPSQDSSSIIYATPLSGHGSEVTAGYSSSFPRQTSFTRVTPLPEGRRRSSSSSGGSIRAVPDSPSVPYRPNVTNLPSTPPPTVAGDTRQAQESRPDSSSIMTSVAGRSRSGSGAPPTLPGASTSGTSNAPQQRREEIHTLLRTYCAKSLQNPPKSPLPGQPTSTSQATSSVGSTEPNRTRTPPGDNQARRISRRRQGQPVHVSIRDQQQPERNQASHAQDDDPLPSNWERGVDSHGRVYYIDHVNRTTTWNRPRRDAPQSESNMNDMNTHWQSLDRRYESFRRTLRGRNSRHSRPPLPAATSRESQTTGEASSSNAEGEVASPRPSGPSSTAASSAQGASTPSASSSASSATNLNSSHAPAVKFLTRSDFIDFLKSKGLAGQYYFQSQMLKLIVSKIRADPNTFDKYRHQVELVRFLNQFADPQMEMPPGWDKKVDQNGRLYYINHNSRTTTFIDPRLPLEETTLPRNRAETEPRRPRVPPPRPPPPRTPTRSSSLSGPSTQITYNQQVVGFLSQPNIDDILKSKYEGYARSPTLKANVRRVQMEGERVLTRLSNNLDFVMLLSVLEESIVSFVPLNAQSAEPRSQPTSPIRELSSPFSGRGGRLRPVSYDPSMKTFMSESTSSSSSSSSPAPYRRDFEAKVRSFHRQLYHNGYGQGPNKIKLSIRRDHILEDAFDQIMKEPARALRRNRLEIQFTGEEGLDYGGPAREFFFLLSRQLFNPYYGLFEYSANDTYTVQVSPVSLYVDNSHEWFKFCGRIIGLVIIHQHLLDAFFTRPFYKALLRSPCDLSDVEALDSLFHQSMTWVMENDITGALDLSFTVSEEIFGQVTERDLVPDGREIEVNESNKHEYVEQMVRWRVERGVSEQMESIVNGFNEVLELNLITIFDARELELVISGTAEIDIRDWRKNTEYRSGYHDNHKVVKWFWKAVSSFDNEQKLRLLQFVTGTSSIPYEGFAALRGSTGPRKFCIERWGEYSKLPRAHTCFNRLDLPVYRSYDELLEKLTFAVEESETFAMQ